MSQFSISWDVQKNICSGLSSLQQNSEFVDMTLAADGHIVKVHQVIMALASPYIKELISSADCPHPVIFLNKVSYETLCSILEYVYTGEVLVSADNLKALIEAGKDLHIKGIENMTVQHTDLIDYSKNLTQSKAEDEYCYLEVEDVSNANIKVKTEVVRQSNTYSDNNVIKSQDYINHPEVGSTEILMQEDDDDINTIYRVEPNAPSSTGETKSVMQYTVSNQGSLQMILNRFVYYVKFTTRRSVRQWRCVDYVNKNRCPAYVITKGDVILKRIGMHNHSFHDKRILKKVKANAVFTALNEAEKEGLKKEKTKSGPHEETFSEEITDEMSETVVE